MSASEQARLELLSQLLEDEGLLDDGEGSPPARIEPRPAGAETPLSFAQQRLFFLDRWQPGNAAYHLHLTVPLPESTDLRALERALNAVVARHEALRTTFAEIAGRAVQVVAQRLMVPLPRVDLSAVGEPATRDAGRIAGALLRRPFDLGRGPLVRALAVTRRDGKLLVVAIHHIVADGWSLDVLRRELLAFYREARSVADSRRISSLLPPLPIQYPDFALWQRNHLAGERLASELGWWRGELEGSPTVLELPADRPRPAVQSFRGAVYRVRLERDLITGARALARERGATLFMVLLAGFGTLLSRYADQEDLLVGSPIANRNRTEVEGLIGFFVNTLPLRVELSGSPSGRVLLDRVRTRTFAAFDHQDLPFEKLVEELRPEREPSRQPLCQVVLGLQSRGSTGLLDEASRGAEATEGRAPAIGSDTAKFDLSVQLAEMGDGVRGGFEFRSDLFEKSTIERLAANFSTLLAALIADPGAPVAELRMLATEEERELIDRGDRRSVSPVFSLFGRFSEQAEARPDAIAIDHGSAHVSYGALLRRARLLAASLERASVIAGDRVGLCLDRSPEMIVSILGTLAVGAAYLPLDPAYPAERLGFLLDDSGVSRVVAGAGERDRLAPWAEASGGRVLPVEDLLVPGAEPGGRPRDIPPELPAYVIYTSGSTGRPKGVVVTHGQVARLFSATDRWFRFGVDDAWTLFHSYAFDFSVWEIWGALLAGGRLTVVPYWTSRSPEAFADLLADAATTVLNQTPSAFRPLDAALASKGALPALRTVIFGGEGLEVSSLAGWFARHGDARPRMVNMYGITETTVHVTYRAVTSRDLAPRVGSPIGVPIPDLSLRVLDRRGQLAPIGVPGEICVGGAGAALGYLGRPELTAARFVPDPFGDFGSRLYRSGDLGRYLPSGEVEHLGRADFQVKVRGFRIEPGEIAAALGRHPGVREAEVILHQEMLVAYWAPIGEGEAPNRADLREHLRERLPEHMVPARFVRVDRIPLTAHGKVDRKALPDPSSSDVGETSRAGEDAPRTAEEEMLAAIWEKVLDLPRVGRDANFFALGGDSIRSLEVLALARARGVRFELQDLFRLRTLAELAAYAADAGEAHEGEAALEERAAGADPGPFGLLSEVDRARVREIAADAEDAYPLARLQAGMLLHMRLAAEEPPYHNVDSWLLQLELEPELLARSLADVGSRHPAMRTSFHLEGFSEPLQIVHAAADLPLRVADLRGIDTARQDEEIARYVGAEKRRLFDLTRAPQLRFFIHRLGSGPNERAQLTVTENHAIFDGWSLHTTLAEVFERYFARLSAQGAPPTEGRSVPPIAGPPKATFRQFVALERAAAESRVGREFWARQLDGATLLALPSAPADLDRSEDGPRMRRVMVPAPEKLSTGLRRLARESAVPLKSLALAAHLRVLSIVGGTPDVVTGMVSNGRPEVDEAEEIRGLFLNSLPLRLLLAGGTWRGLIEEAFEAERELLQFRRFPLADLQQRRGGALFEVLFNYIHFHVIEDLLRGGRVEVLGFAGREGTNYPLQVVFTPGHLDRGVHVTFEYDARRLGRDQVETLGRRMMAAFSAMVAEPGARYDEDPLLSESEWRQLALDNRTAVDFGPSRPIPDRIVERAASHPDAIALSFGDGGPTEHLSYGEMERASRRRALRIRRSWRGGSDRSRGSAERRVVVLLPRSLDLPLSLFAVLRAGAAYVPIDPDYPEARRAWMLEDAAPDAVITTEALAAELPAGRFETILVDSESARTEAIESTERGTEVLPAIDPRSLAYVIYTSGSTGRPKGAGNAHAAIENRLLWMQRAYPLDFSDTVAQKTPTSFDVSVWEFFWPLIEGARLAVAKPEGHRDASWLARWLAEEQVTTLHFVPSMLSAFLDAPGANGTAWRSLRRAIASGEALPPETVDRFFDRFPAAELHNLYGPTEAAVDVTAHECRPGASIVPIGRPIANLTIHLLDVHGAPAPPGTPGELYIGGVGVGRGYTNRPDLTALRFVPDPFAGLGPGARLYRTGDLARRRDDGAIEFLGRLDHQVKIRGLRIELGEIEAALGALPEVAASVVVAARGADGGARLAAYVVPRDADAAEDTGERLRLRDRAREALAARLPEYMVPSDWVILPEFPLSPNGKLDRRALPRPEVARVAEEGAESDRPRTPTEELLAVLWSDLLGTGEIGRGQSFFDLGGHSLLATRMSGRIRALFGADLALPEIFAHPKLAAMAEAIDRSRHGSQGIASPALTRASRDGRLPLSFAQERLWFLDRLEPGSPAYNVPLLARLAGRLEPAALAAALACVAARHEILRTRYPETPDGPEQRIAARHEGPGARLPEVDLSALGAAERSERALDRAARRVAVAPFDLARGPVFRAVLFRLAETDFALLLAIHHIATDGGSHGVLLRDLAAYYAASRGDSRAVPAPLPIQYADYSVWQRALLSEDASRAEIEWWRERLAGRPPLDLPTDRPRPRVARHRGDVRTGRLSREERGRLVSGARTAQATLFMAVAAAFGALLSRWSGQARVALGTPISGRDRAELEPLIGLFVNTVVIEVDGATDGPRSLGWNGLLARVRSSALGAYAHSDLPFDRVVEALEPERDLARTPVFQAMVQLEIAAAEREGPADPDGLRLALRPLATPVARFELSLGAVDLGDRDGLGLLLGFDTDLFDPATAERMLEAWKRLLLAALAEPDRPVVELPLLSSAERHQVAIEISDSAKPAPPDSVPGRIAGQAGSRPDAVAVHGEGVHLSYGELDRRALRLAERLRMRHGVGDETVVALAAERTPSMVVGLLGIWYAGGAYLPLDRTYPVDRLALMLGDSGTKILLGDGVPLPMGAVPEGVAVLPIDEATVVDAGLPASWQPDTIQLAYVIYTSGSTGRPKGVAVPHGALANFIASMEEHPGLGPDGSLLAVTSLSFDIAGLELWLTLSAGGRVELATRAEAADGRRLLCRLEESGAGALQGTPATWRLLIDAGWSGGEAEIRVLVGGEALPDRLAVDLRARSRSVFNLYGPTETTIWSAVAAVAGPGGSIGRPIANTRLSIVDRAGELAPIGVAGELWIGGDGVARGYLGRPDLTAGRFVPAERGGRAYRTGDLARFRPDGTVEFLGRIDSQVKVRGYRIELGEVEAALGALPGVRQAVAAVRGEGEAKVLVGYLVPEAAVAAAEGASLRALLARTLPDSMIPQAFVGLDAFPLTPNGKVDRRALPVPASDGGGTEDDAPRSTAEELIATIFAEVLGRDRVGRDRSFFDLGGHSLLATRAMVRIAEAFGVEVPLVRMFERPSPAGLAETVAELRGAGLGASAPVLQPRSPAAERPPLSFSQQRLWLLDRLGLAGAAYNLPFGVRLARAVPAGRIRAAVAALADRHEVLRTSLPSASGEAWQEVSARLARPLVVADLRGLAEPRRAAEGRRILALVARAPFDLAAGPLFRALAVDLPSQQDLLLVFHHTVADGWSIQIALRDLAEIARALGTGTRPALPPLPVQYADFSLWQRDLVSGAALDALLAHWRERLEGLPAALALPFDRPRRTTARRQQAGAARVALPRPAASALRALSRRSGATPFMALFAAFGALLARVSGQNDFALGTPSAGRTRRELEPMIGFFANTLVLRSSFAGRESFADLLTRARSTALDAFDHQDLPFERLVEELRPERDLAVHPLFQVMFQMQVEGAVEGEWVLGARSGSSAFGAPIEVARGAARFDLILSLSESDEGIAGLFEYDPELFDPATVLHLAARFATLVACVAEAPIRSPFEVDLLSAPERHQTVHEWNSTAIAGSEAAAPVSLHGPILRATAMRPDAVALSCGGSHLTYGALDRLSARLAGRIRELSEGAMAEEPLVAVALERSLELPTALLAVVRAGAAYVPIDPDYPRERQAWMLEDARPIAVITTRSRAETLPLGGVPAVWAEDLAIERGEAVASGAAPRFEFEIAPDRLAYAIFTSGSTGRPKGAMNSHGAIDNRLLWMQAAYPLTQEDVVAQKTPASFDVSVWEFFWPLRQGARMALAAPGLHRDPAGLARFIAEEGVTTIHFVPSMLRAFLDERDAASHAGSLRRVIASGEALGPDLARRFHQVADSSLSARRAELHNLYGPTEAAVDVTFHPCRPGEVSVPIGRPISRLAIHLVDARGDLVPPGSPGELLIGGVGLGRGYLRRPDLTAERFVPDALSGSVGARLYRTGDLARRRADGAIEYLGRIDHQVKVRGVRIELGEIEAALGALPEVAQAVVLAEGTETRLTAFLVASGGARPEARALRAALSRTLPEPLLPARFVWLDELPLSPSGKADRRALSAIGAASGARAGAGVEYEPPSTSLEELIAAVYAELLGLERLGVRESFFDLGGHSLLATRAAARLSEGLGIEVPLARLFERPTVGGLAAALVAESAAPRELERAAALALDLAHMSDEDVAALLTEYELRAPVPLDAERELHRIGEIEETEEGAAA